jgi:hypothetical protein
MTASLAVAAPRSARPGGLREPTARSPGGRCPRSPARASNTSGTLPDNLHRSPPTSGLPQGTSTAKPLPLAPPPCHPWRPMSAKVPAPPGASSAGTSASSPSPPAKQAGPGHAPLASTALSVCPVSSHLSCQRAACRCALRLAARHLAHHNRPHPPEDPRTPRCPPGAPSMPRHPPGAGKLASLWCPAHRPEPRLALAQAPRRDGMRSQCGPLAHVVQAALARDRGRDCGVLSAGQRPAGTLWAGGNRHPITPREVQPPAHRGSSPPDHPVSCLPHHPLFAARPYRP